MIVVWLFLTVQWVCLQFVMVVFPDHTHYFKMCLKLLILCTKSFPGGSMTLAMITIIENGGLHFNMLICI